MPDAGSPKVVLVTGASTGIGAAVARELARQGYSLVLTARRSGRLEQLADELRQTGVEVLVLAADLADPATPERLVSEVVARFGGLDVLVNNAGFGLPTLFADAAPADLRRQLGVNFVQPLMLARWALPHLIARRGTIINIGSAISSVPNSALGAYGATKAGLAYWNDALRRELAHKGVKVCLVEPGPVQTEFFRSLEALAPPGGRYNPLLDAPAAWMSARVEDVARRIVRLIDHPRRRISVRRRVVWPFRLIGGLFQVWPALGDLALSSMTRYFDRKGDLARTHGRLGDARPSE
ncbi:MAG: SDR family NAD(P)-dependent oxidoreductase [Planctomycetaceae bacterium]|nr:SDR family NAD(P)-dependent oxidoreductase [Planctomycetaceae bacterium]